MGQRGMKPTFFKSPIVVTLAASVILEGVIHSLEQCTYIYYIIYTLQCDRLRTYSILLWGSQRNVAFRSLHNKAYYWKGYSVSLKWLKERHGAVRVFHWLFKIKVWLAHKVQTLRDHSTAPRSITKHCCTHRTELLPKQISALDIHCNIICQGLWNVPVIGK